MLQATRRRLTPQQREAITASMKGVITRSPREGLARRLFTGEDVEQAIKSPLEALKSDTSKNIDAKINAAVKSMEVRIKASFVKALDNFEEKILLAIAGIKPPENGKPGHTPTEEEMASVVTKVLAGMSKAEANPETKEQDQNALIELIRKEAESIVKSRPSQVGGGGVTYAFQIKDMPNKTRGVGPTYAGNEGKALIVSPDGKSFTFGQTSGGGMTPLAAAETPNGSITAFTFDEPPVIIATEFGFFIEDATHGFTLSGNVATLPIAPSNFVKGYK